MKKLPTLFLDRDGVINRRTPGDYVKHPSEFVPETGAMQALGMLSPHFSHIVVVTNQAGVGKGVMNETDLAAVHQKMRTLAGVAGGRIDGIYYCPHRPDAGCACRKPATGMAMQARSEFPEIDFSRAWMVGDSASDMVFGKTLGMKTILINGKFEDTDALDALSIDDRFDSLFDFARFFLAQI